MKSYIYNQSFQDNHNADVACEEVEFVPLDIVLTTIGQSFRTRLTNYLQI